MADAAPHHPVEGHPHTHDRLCGHAAVTHDDHVDFLHDGHVHHVHEDHVDEEPGADLGAHVPQPGTCTSTSPAADTPRWLTTTMSTTCTAIIGTRGTMSITTSTDGIVRVRTAAPPGPSQPGRGSAGPSRGGPGRGPTG